MAWDYTDQVKNLFNNAIQHGKDSHMGEIEDADGVGQHGSIVCGDAITFYLKVQKAENPLEDKIVQVKYKTFGCTSAIASSEALCALIEQKKPTPIEALNITNDDIVKFLGGLPKQKIHCSVMGAEVLEAAIKDWSEKRGVNLEEIVKRPVHEEIDEGDIVCECFNLTRPYIERKVKELNLKNLGDIKNAIKAGGGCSTCTHVPGGLEDILKEVWGEEATPEKKSDALPEDLQAQIENYFSTELAAIIKKEGIALELVKVKKNKVYVEIVDEGVEADVLLKTIETKLQENIHPEIVVIDL